MKCAACFCRKGFKGETGKSSDQSSNVIVVLLFLLQVFSVPTQVWPLRSDSQGDPHRLPLHQPGQSQEEQADGHGRVGLDPQSQQLLHQFCQFCGLLGRRAAQSEWAGKEPVFV